MPSYHKWLAYYNICVANAWTVKLCREIDKDAQVGCMLTCSSVELFVDGGRIAMTNLVFPVAPYENVKLYTQGGKAEFKNMKVHKLGL